MNRTGSALKNHIVQIEELYVLCFFILLVLLTALLSPAFLTAYNILNILSTASIYGIMACGMTFVITTGGIDISAGSVLGFGGAAMAAVLGNTDGTRATQLVRMPVAPAVLFTLALCALLGLLNGLSVTKLKVPPFIQTMGMLQACRGLTYLLTGGFPITFKEENAAFRWIGSGFLGKIPTLVVIFAAVAIACFWVFRKTAYGRKLSAIGGNPEAARESGVRTDRCLVMTYVVMAVLSGLSGIILTSRLGSAVPEAGTNYELDVITAVVIGGTSMSGGKGTMLGTLIGVFTMVVLSNCLNLLGVQSIYQYISKGAVLLAAVSLDSVMKERRGY